MKVLLGACGLALACALASCGGGGGGGGGYGGGGGGGSINPPTTASPTPGPIPTTTASPTPGPHTVSIGWSGAMAPGGSIALSTSPAPILSLTCEQAIETCPSSGGVSTTLPEVYPTLTTQESGVTTQQQPSISSNKSGLAQGSWALSSGAYSTQVGATGATAPGIYGLTVTFPDGSNAQTSLYVYHRATIGCGGAANGTSFSEGYSFDNLTTVTAISGADVYLTGPACSSQFNAASWALNFPAGATLVTESTSADFATLTPAQWANNCPSGSSCFTTLSQAQVQSLLSSGATTAVLVKTAAGYIAKIQVTNGAFNSGTAWGNDTYISGAYWVSSGGSFSQ